MTNIKLLRKAAGINQAMLSEKIGVSRSTIAMWETDGSTPDVMSLQKLSDYFDVPIDFIVNGSPVEWEHPSLIDDYYNASDADKLYIVEKRGIDCRIASDYFSILAKNKKPAPENGDELSEAISIFSSLTPANRDKLLELAQLFLNDQNKNEDTQ